MGQNINRGIIIDSITMHTSTNSLKNFEDLETNFFYLLAEKIN